MTEETAIATTKKEQLREQEEIIERGIKTFVEVGNALALIKVQELFVHAGYSSFADYCEAKWGYRRSRAYQLMDAATIAGELSTIVEMPPTNEAQVRELAKLPDTASRASLWEKLTKESGGNVTVKRVTEAVGRSITTRASHERREEHKAEGGVEGSSRDYSRDDNLRDSARRVTLLVPIGPLERWIDGHRFSPLKGAERASKLVQEAIDALRYEDEAESDITPQRAPITVIEGNEPSPEPRTIQITVQERSQEQRREAERLEARTIEITVKDREGSEQEVVTAYQCEECGEISEETAGGQLYACGNCGTIFSENNSGERANQCPDCNKFASMMADDCCALCEAGMVEEVACHRVDGELTPIDEDQPDDGQGDITDAAC